MLIKDIAKSTYFKAIDETTLCELIHPEKDNVKMDCSIAHAILAPDQSSLPHKLINSIEIYYILEGMGKIFINTESKLLKTGQSVYIPSNACQRIRNIGKTDLKFLCIVSPPWSEEDETICK